VIGNWGRWGAEDERGAANLLDPGAVRKAVALVKTGEVVELGGPLGPLTPMPPHRRGAARFMDRDAGDYEARRPGHDGFGFAEDSIMLSTHAGTHVDALAHVWSERELYNGHPAGLVQSRRGAERCGIDKLGPIVTRGVLLDFVAEGATAVEADLAIGPDELEHAYRTIGLEPEPGDAVLLRTGWWELHGGAAHDYFEREPGLSVAGARWLAEFDPVLVGADNYAVEIQPAPDGARFPVHLILMRDHGIPLLENLELGGLADRGATDFLLVVAPLRLVGSTGSPVNPVAVL